MEEMDSCFAPQKYPNEAGHTSQEEWPKDNGAVRLYLYISDTRVDAGALRLSIAGNSLTGPAGSKVRPKMSHDGAAGTQAPQNVA